MRAVLIGTVAHYSKLASSNSLVSPSTTTYTGRSSDLTSRPTISSPTGLCHRPYQPGHSRLLVQCRQRGLAVTQWQTLRPPVAGRPHHVDYEFLQPSGSPTGYQRLAHTKHNCPNYRLVHSHNSSTKSIGHALLLQ